MQKKIMDRELDHLKPTGLTFDIKRCNSKDFQSYVGTMRVEIENVRKLIDEKNKVQ